MVTCSEIMAQIEDWLRSGRPDAENLIDFPWEVERNENGLDAVHPKIPVRIRIRCSDEAKSLRAITWLGVPTITMSNDARLILYRKMLRASGMPMVKYMLIGDEDLIGAAVDLSIESLGKKEFNDALAFLLTGINNIASEIGELDELYKQMMNELIYLIKKHFEEGWGREKLIKYLTELVGMSRDDAVKLLYTLGMIKRDEGVTMSM